MRAFLLSLALVLGVFNSVTVTDGLIVKIKSGVIQYDHGVGG